MNLSAIAVLNTVYRPHPGYSSSRSAPVDSPDGPDSPPDRGGRVPPVPDVLRSRDRARDVRRGALSLAVHVRRPAQRHPLHGLRARSVFATEIDVELFEEAERGAGYGTLKLAREPLACCAFTVEKAHESPARIPLPQPALRRLPRHGPGAHPGVRSPTRSRRSVKDPLQAADPGQDPRIRCRRPGDPGPLAMDQIRRGNYDSGQDYVLEYGELRFTFNERDFSERVEQAARKLGFVGQSARGHRARGPREPHRQRRGRRPRLRPRRARQRLLAGPRRPRRPLARALAAAARLPLRLAGPAREGGRARRRLRRRTHTFGYVQPERDREPIELSPEPSWRRVAYGPRRYCDAGAAARVSDGRRAARGAAARARPAARPAAASRASARPASSARPLRFAAGFFAAVLGFGRGAASSPPSSSRPASWRPRAARLGLGGRRLAGRRRSRLRASTTPRAASAAPWPSRRRLGDLHGRLAARRGRRAPGPATGAARRRPRRGSRAAPASPTSSSGRSVPDSASASAGKLPERGRPRGRARRRSSRRRPAPATWRSRSASRRRRGCGPRPARAARRRPGRYSKPSISTTASPPRAATRRPVSTACSTACACASTEAANVSAALGVTGQSATSSGPHAGQHGADLEPDSRARARPRAGAAPRSCPSATGRR